MTILGRLSGLNVDGLYFAFFAPAQGMPAGEFRPVIREVRDWSSGRECGILLSCH
jgi:hypothetical protein